MIDYMSKGTYEVCQVHCSEVCVLTYWPHPVLSHTTKHLWRKRSSCLLIWQNCCQNVKKVNIDTGTIGEKAHRSAESGCCPWFAVTVGVAVNQRCNIQYLLPSNWSPTVLNVDYCCVILKAVWMFADLVLIHWAKVSTLFEFLQERDKTQRCWDNTGMWSTLQLMLISVQIASWCL